MYDLLAPVSFSLWEFTPVLRGGGFFKGAYMKLVLDAKELAVALSLPVTTIQQYASKYPDKLPPRLKTPSRKLLWSIKDVEAWVDQHRASAEPAPELSGCNTPVET